MTGKPDPITFAVVRNGFISAAYEMYSVFKRTAMLPILYEFNDFGMSLFDDRLNMLADAPGLPIFVGSLDTCLAGTIETLGGAETLRPGDVLLNNHPYLTGGQTADAAVMEPIFFDGKLIGFTALRAHMGDFGAINPYPCNSTDLYQEGTLFAALKLYDGGALNETITKIMADNSRLPTETVGSVLAGAGAVRACSRKVVSIVEKYGLEVYYSVIDELLDQGERATREAISEFPDGTYELVDYLDSNGLDEEPVRIQCAVTVAGSDVTIDLDGSAPEQAGPINCPYGYTLTTCRFALKRLTTPDLPPNSGGYRPLTVIAPEGSLFDPRPPAPCFISAWTAMRLGDMIVQALAPALPGRVPAEHGGDIIATLAYVRDPGTSRICFFFDLAGLGFGAMEGKDGMNALMHPMQAGSESMPAELLETRMPVLKRGFSLVTDSGGAGEFRGGLSAAAEFEFESDGSAVVVAEKTKASEVRGLAGGMSPPFKNAVIVFPGTEGELRLGKKADIAIAPGDRLIVRPAGGGGYGDPLERAPERVARDVEYEYVSPEQAERAYGVVLDPGTGEVDLEATDRLRERLREARGGVS